MADIRQVRVGMEGTVMPRQEDEDAQAVRDMNAALRRNMAQLRPVAGTDSVSYDVTEAVSLTPKEREVFTFLLEVNATFSLGSTLRVAGGWVRDKVREFLTFTYSCFVKIK